MAATVQSDAYVTLSRKIGYSVGLENIVDRVKALVRLYIDSEAGLRVADWKSLVSDNFNRKGPGYEHIANFYSSINLIRLTNNEIHTLPRLEVLSILARYFSEQPLKYERALRFILALSLIEADGDIFLNCLTAEFDRTTTRRHLAMMIQAKWDVLKGLIQNPSAQARIWDIVSIKKQPASTLQVASSKSSRFATRLTPLETVLRPTRTDLVEKVADVQDSYLDKVLPTRKGWARDLALIDAEGKLSEAGQALLTNLRAAGLSSKGGAFRFWAYPYDLAHLRLTYADLNSESIDEWGTSVAIYKAFGGTALTDHAPDDTALVDLMRQCYSLYRSADRVRGAIRHQIPIYVIRPTLLGVFLANEADLPDIPTFISAEIKGTARRFDVTNVRGTEGAITFR